jgi:hypothetical protein
VPEELRRAPENYVELPKDDKNMLKFLRMCEAARGGPQDGRQIQCDQDPTCVQCIPEYKMVSEEAPFTPVSSRMLSFQTMQQRQGSVRRWALTTTPHRPNGRLNRTGPVFATRVRAQRGAQKLLRAYTNATLAERRVEYIRTSFPLDADVPVRQREAVIVISSNTRGIHLILNWACGCERKGMADVRDHTLVLATDDAAHEYAARAGFHSLHPELFGHAMDEDDPSLPNPGATSACLPHPPRAPLSTGQGDSGQLGVLACGRSMLVSLEYSLMLTPASMPPGWGGCCREDRRLQLSHGQPVDRTE